MKVNNQAQSRKGLVGGSLNGQYTAVYAEYLAKVCNAYRDRGVPFYAITMQNEPDFSPGNYAGMYLTSHQETDLAIAVGKSFKQNGVNTKILVHDHNWDNSWRAYDILGNAEAHQYVAGVAFHCYGGDVSAQTTIRNVWPEKEYFFTECSGTLGNGNFASNLMWNTRTLVIGAIRNWAKSVLVWSLALDQNGNPHIGGCPNCRGVVTINSESGHISKNEEYYALASYGKVV
jgi:glucosylceramidase